MKSEMCETVPAIPLIDIMDRLYSARSARHLANDPLSFCHRYSDPADQEVAAVIASSFAYGNVKIILRTLETIFAELGQSPRKYLECFDPVSYTHLRAHETGRNLV